MGKNYHNSGSPYDLDSIMHYHPFAFSDKEIRKPVITKPDGSWIPYKTPRSFSKYDIEEINHVYDCDMRGLCNEFNTNYVLYILNSI